MVCLFAKYCGVERSYTFNEFYVLPSHLDVCTLMPRCECGMVLCCFATCTKKKQLEKYSDGFLPITDNHLMIKPRRDIQSHFADAPAEWILFGLTRKTGTNHFVDPDGKHGWTNWDSGQPNGRLDEDCAVARRSFPKWHDINCNQWSGIVPLLLCQKHIFQEPLGKHSVVPF